jgi:hypothetical protein
VRPGPGVEVDLGELSAIIRTSSGWAIVDELREQEQRPRPVLVSRMTLCSVVIIPRRTFFSVGR